MAADEGGATEEPECTNETKNWLFTCGNVSSVLLCFALIVMVPLITGKQIVVSIEPLPPAPHIGKYSPPAAAPPAAAPPAAALARRRQRGLHLHARLPKNTTSSRKLGTRATSRKMIAANATSIAPPQDDAEVPALMSSET